MLTIGQRIQRLRKQLGEKQATFAQRFGVDQSTVSKWEKGSQVPDPEHRDIIASLELSDEDLVEGDEMGGSGSNPLFTLVPIAGYVGAGAVVHLIDTDAMPGSLGYIKAPKGFGAVEALVVQGDSMYPAYKNGDIIYYSGRPAEMPIRSADEYVVRLKNGQVLVKVVEPVGADGRYTLTAYNAPSQRGVEIAAASKVRYVRKK